MKYDTTTHRWSLELTDTTTLFGDISKRYGGVEKAERELLKQSRTVYFWIYDQIPTTNKDFVEYSLAKDTALTGVLKEALLSQLEYDLETGGNSVAKQIGIDFSNGGSMSRGRIAKSQVGIETEQILRNASSSFNLLYAGDFGIRLEDDRYTARGY